MEWLILTLLSVGTLWADEQALCPCIPTNLCPGNAPLEEQGSCDDTGLIRCCAMTQVGHHEDMQEIVGEHLTKEQEIMSALDSLLENMNVNIQTSNSAERFRENKSYSNNLNTKNHLDQKDKQSKEPLENLSVGLGDIIDGDQKDDSDVPNLSQPLVQNPNITSTGKVFVVYAEKPSKNNAPFNEDKVPPHIVLPLQDSSSEIKENPTENEEQESGFLQSSVKISTEQNDDQLNIEQRNIHNKKHKHHLYSLKALERNNNNKIEDSEASSSEFHEITEEKDIDKMSVTRSPGLSPIHIPNIPTEQININKQPFRSPPRRLLPRPGSVKSEENRQMSKNVLELLKDRSKGRMGLKPIRIPVETTPNSNIPSINNPNHDALMANLNLRTINSIMKTNFSSQIPDTIEPTPATEFNHQAPTKSHNVMSSVLRENSQQEQTIDDGRNSSATERGGNKASIRGRFRSRLQPTQHSVAEAMSQGDVSQDSSRLQDSLKRLQSRRRLRTKPQANDQEQVKEPLTSQINENNHTTNVQNSQEQFTSPKPASSFSSRRLRPRTKINTKNTSTMNPSEESKTTPQSAVLQDGFTDSKPLQDKNSQVKSEGDLEGSGSDHNPQQFSFQGRFLPPERMESGFEPMLNGHNLQTIGPVPRRLAQSSLETNTNVIGLELPLPESQVQFGQRSTFAFNKIPEQFLLPPVSPAPQPPTFQNDFAESDAPALLPPVEVPSTSDSATNKPKDYIQINSELDSLKNRYEILLEKYSDALSVYNDRFKQFFN